MLFVSAPYDNEDTRILIPLSRIDYAVVTVGGIDKVRVGEKIYCLTDRLYNCIVDIHAGRELQDEMRSIEKSKPGYEAPKYNFDAW